MYMPLSPKADANQNSTALIMNAPSNSRTTSTGIKSNINWHPHTNTDPTQLKEPFALPRTTWQQAGGPPMTISLSTSGTAFSHKPSSPLTSSDQPTSTPNSLPKPSSLALLISIGPPLHPRAPKFSSTKSLIAEQHGPHMASKDGT